jgi:hypothetical protein
MALLGLTDIRPKGVSKRSCGDIQSYHMVVPGEAIVEADDGRATTAPQLAFRRLPQRLVVCSRSRPAGRSGRHAPGDMRKLRQPKALPRQQPRRYVRCRGLRAIKRRRAWPAVSHASSIVQAWRRVPSTRAFGGEACSPCAVPWVLLAPWACGRSTGRGSTRRSTGLAMAHAPHTRPAAASVPDAKVSVRDSQRCAAGV